MLAVAARRNKNKNNIIINDNIIINIPQRQQRRQIFEFAASHNIIDETMLVLAFGAAIAAAGGHRIWTLELRNREQAHLLKLQLDYTKDVEQRHKKGINVLRDQNQKLQQDYDEIRDWREMN